MMLFDVQDFDPAAEGGDDVEQRGAGGVHAEGVEDQVRIREEQGSTEEEGGGGEVAGNRGVDGFELLAAGNAQLFAFTRKCRAKCLEGLFGMVAGADGFGEAGSAVGLETGEEDGCLDLGGWDGRVEVDSMERAADYGHGTMATNGTVAAGEVDLGAHLRERLANALHGTLGERVVANQGEGVRMRGDEAGQHSHGAAGVAAVERVLGLAKGSGGAGNLDGLVFFANDSCAECFHAAKRRVRIGAGGEVGEPGGAFGEAGKHGVAV